MAEKSVQYNPRVILNRVNSFDTETVQPQSEESISTATLTKNTVSMAESTTSNEQAAERNDGNQSEGDVTDVTLINLDISDVTTVDNLNPSRSGSEQQNTRSVIMFLLNFASPNNAHHSNVSTTRQNELRNSIIPTITCDTIDSKENLLASIQLNIPKPMDQLVN